MKVVILVLSQVIKMRHFKYIISVFLINIIYSQDCIKGDCRDGYGEKKWDKTSWYNEDGSLSSQSEYLEGRSHGKTIIYYDSGKKLEMNYDRGVYVKK